MYELRKGPLSFIKFIVEECYNLFFYITVCLMFVAFVVWNKGIVIGDRTAHVATIHVCQIFYFSAFVSLFSWPYVMPHGRACLHFFRRYWIFASCVVVLMATVIHFKTLVHPYVLADNRHYLFYVWNRFMGRYAMFKYLLIPVYCASLFAISRNISHLRFLTQINYIICVCMILIPQLLVEPRYFILPYIFYRLNMKRPEKWQIYLESLTTCTINFLQFFIFSNKVFYWEDQLYAQRISWWYLTWKRICIIKKLIYFNIKYFLSSYFIFFCILNLTGDIKLFMIDRLYNYISTNNNLLFIDETCGNTAKYFCTVTVCQQFRDTYRQHTIY